MVEGWTVSPRKSRKKSACFSSTVTGHAGAGEQQPGHHPGRPAADDQDIATAIDSRPELHELRTTWVRSSGLAGRANSDPALSVE